MRSGIASLVVLVALTPLACGPQGEPGAPPAPPAAPAPAPGAGAALPLASIETPLPPLPTHWKARVPAAADIPPVSDEMLRDPLADRGRWLHYGGDYRGYRHSPLSSLDPESVRRLQVAWSFPTGTTGQFEVSPVLYGGVLYVTGSYNRLFALDARSGEVLWRYDHKLPADLRACCGPVNRGVAISGDAVLMATLDAKLLAFDRRSGEILWQTEIAPYAEGYAATSAPLVVAGRAFVGVGGGEYGSRGFFDAYDVASGRRVWRHYTVPAAGEPGAESWAGHSNESGGAPSWTQGAYDAASDTLFWTTGNPSPDFNGDLRAGDNLFSNSLLAVDPASGARKWHFQFTPHDVWDFDGNTHLFLIDLRQGAQTVPVIAQANRNGYFYLIDRRDGRFLRATQYVEQMNWATIGSDGRPQVNPQAFPTEEGSVRICPGNMGGMNGAWTGAYDPALGLAYIPAIESCQRYKKGLAVFVRGAPFLGGIPDTIDAVEGKAYGLLHAIDVASGEIRWRFRDAHPLMAGALSTAGGVVFSGTLDGRAIALDARTGELLWSFRMGGGVRSQPVAYELDGRSYVVYGSGSWSTTDAYIGGIDRIPEGGQLFVFELRR